jgi:hypothetical protein
VKFNGELKFPEIDHPGVPVQFLIEGDQAELVVEGESLGKWSLYDIRARRLVASAFMIDLDGTEVTFVANDPVDFAYRGVEHMAETWASIKSKRIGRRTIAVRKSRKGVVAPRIEDLRVAMETNLEAQPARPIAGEPSMPTRSQTWLQRQAQEPEPSPAPADSEAPARPADERPSVGRDWDRRDQAGAIPIVGSETSDEADPAGRSKPEPVPQPHPLTEEQLQLEEERRRIAEERARLEQERLAAEQREANLLEAYRLEMQRLEAEREEVRLQAAEAAERAAAARAGNEPVESSFTASLPDPGPEPEPERVAEPESAPEPGFDPAAEDQEPVPARVLDLNDYEADGQAQPPAPAAATGSPQPEPVLAGAPKDKGGGLMGAVKAAFRSGPKDHAHQFVEAPGGMGITRNVCEECGYVSISG